MLYDALLRLKPSPVVALNRAIAVSKVDGPERGLEEILAMANASRLDEYPFYWAAQGELQATAGRLSEAKTSFERAHLVARNDAERDHLQSRVVA